MVTGALAGDAFSTSTVVADGVMAEMAAASDAEVTVAVTVFPVEFLLPDACGAPFLDFIIFCS